jgi:hypothetical protein
VNFFHKLEKDIKVTSLQSPISNAAGWMESLSTLLPFTSISYSLHNNIGHLHIFLNDHMVYPLTAKHVCRRVRSGVRPSFGLRVHMASSSRTRDNERRRVNYPNAAKVVSLDREDICLE